MRARQSTALGLALGVGLAPAPASAHLVGMEFGDFYAGALHLLTSPASLALLLAFAVLAGLQARERARWALLALPFGLLAGVGLAAALPVPEDPTASASGFAAMGLLAAFALRLPAWALGAFAAASGLVVGAENGAAGQGAEIDWLLFAAGIAATGTLLGTLLIAASAALHGWRGWVALAQRALGSWFAAVGAMALALSLAGA